MRSSTHPHVITNYDANLSDVGDQQEEDSLKSPAGRPGLVLSLDP